MAKNYIDNLSEETRKGMTEKAAERCSKSVGEARLMMPDYASTYTP